MKANKTVIGLVKEWTELEVDVEEAREPCVLDQVCQSCCPEASHEMDSL